MLESIYEFIDPYDAEDLYETSSIVTLCDGDTSCAVMLQEVSV